MIVTVDQYRAVTGDQTTPEASVTLALADAQELLEDELDRSLESAERTETVVVRPRGYVYPRAVPVTAIAADSPSTGELRSDGFSVRLTSAPSVLVDLPSDDYDDTEVREVSLKYTGGYTEATLPYGLRRGLARLAYALTQASTRGGAGARPYGATSVSLGDASVSYATAVEGTVDELVPGLCRSLAAFRRKTVR